jgi:hypothetical protein
MSPKHVEHRIVTWQDSYGAKRWHFVLKKFVRVTFKRSKRVGWRWMGFVRSPQPTNGFDSRSEALAFAKDFRKSFAFQESMGRTRTSGPSVL